MFNKRIVFFSVLLLITTLILILKTKEHFQVADCSRITDCKTCSSKMGCTFCKKAQKCVFTTNQYSSCPEDTYLNAPDDCVNCSAIKDCKTCAGLNACVFCKSSNRCVSSTDADRLCLRESKSVDPKACDVTRYDISGITYDFDVSGSISSIYDQLNSGVYDSDLNTNKTFEYSDISLQYPNTSIIPILGLSRDINGHLTQASLKTIIQGAKNNGYMLNTKDSKQKLLDDVSKELNFYITTKKSYMKKFLNNSVEYENDPDSLNKIKEIDIKITDLNDISGFIKGLNVTEFKEGYQNDQKDIFEYVLEKNKITAGYLQSLWMLNLIGIGVLVYFINK